jgi:putative Holliday junction resolvase
MRYLGIDYGTVRVGLALSDESGAMGFPHGIVPNTPRLLDTIVTLLEKENVGAVVIGESKDFMGEDNKIAAAARELGARVLERAKVPVYFESETFTSVEARRKPSKELKSRAPKARGAIDASAAALILTSYLSRANHG